MWADDEQWYSARLQSPGSVADSWLVVFTEYGNLQDNTMADMLRPLPSVTPTVVLLAAPEDRLLQPRVSRGSVRLAASTSRFFALEQERLRLLQSRDAVDEALETAAARLRHRQGACDGELARVNNAHP